MHRREFIDKAGRAIAVGALVGCACSSSRRLGFASPSIGGNPSPEPTGAPTPMDAAAFRAGRRLATTPFGRVAYVERGTGDAALFLHGFPFNGFQWRGALERLWPVRRCIAPDFLGLGYSEVADGQSLAPLAQLVLVVAKINRRSESLRADNAGR